MSEANRDQKQTAKRPAFVFIEETGPGAGKASKETRRAIRSQAKRYAIAERSKRPRQIKFVKAKVKETESSRGTPESDETVTSDSTLPLGTVVDLSEDVVTVAEEPELTLTPAKIGYEHARLGFGYDVHLLSGLASVHLGKGTSLKLQEKRLWDWLNGYKEPSYLDLVPMIYDSSSLLKSVVDCTMAQYRYTFAPNPQASSQVYQLYGKALMELQTALNDEHKRLAPDVLLATAVLQLFEILQNDTTSRWSYHTLGLLQLLQMRDPDTFTSVEMSLLACQLGPLINECFLRQIDCVFEHPKWSPVMLALQNNNAFITSLIQVMIKFGRFARIGNQHIVGKDGNLHEKNAALKEMRDLRLFCQRWEQQLEEHMKAKSPAELLNLHELPCAVWSAQLLLNILLISISPLDAPANGPSPSVLLDEIHMVSGKIIDWWEYSKSLANERNDRMLTYPIITARCARSLEPEFRGAVEGREGFVDGERGTISKRIFDRWSSLVRTKAPTRKYKYIDSSPAPR